MRTIVVTGVAGSLGQRVAAGLAARPDVDRVVGIDIVPPDSPEPKLDRRVVDLALPGGPDDRLVAAFESADSVIHLAWQIPDGGGSGRDGQPPAGLANRRALDRVLAAAAITRPEVLVHLSSATVYGAWPDNQVPLTEDSPLRPNPEFAYAVGKAEAERRLAEWAEDHPDTRVAVLRPAVTLGSPEPLYEALAPPGRRARGTAAGPCSISTSTTWPTP